MDSFKVEKPFPKEKWDLVSENLDWFFFSHCEK